ncbi:hypothetical protein COE15_06805 [Bacillus cereus]|nr:hypothetical protein COE15_06805 [Bacillus cereus]
MTNKKKLEFTYCYIRYGKFTASWIVKNAFIKIAAALVGYPFVALADLVDRLFGQLVIELEK